MAIISFLKPVNGTIAHFAQEGKTVEGGAISQTGTPPAGTTFTTWQALGCLGPGSNIQNNKEGGETIDCFDASSMLFIEKTTSRGAKRFLSGVLELQDVSDFVIGILLGGEVNSSTGKFTPSEMVDDIRGFLNFQVYNEGEGKYIDLMMWCEIGASDSVGLSDRSKGQSVSLTYKQLKSSSDKGTVTDPNAE